MSQTLHMWTRLLSAALLCVSVSACMPTSDSNSTVASGEVETARGVIDDDFMTAGAAVRVDAEIGGDLAAAGRRVTVAGPVDGYVMSAGRTVQLDGPIGNDLWAAGETVQLGGSVGNNAHIAGRTVRIGANATIGRDARLAGNTVRTEGRVERNLAIGAAAAQIGGEVGGDVVARAARVTVLPGALIHGNLDVRAAQPPEISPDAVVMGQVQYEERRQDRGWTAWLALWLLWFGALLVMGVATTAFVPGWAARVSATLRARTGRSFLTGLIAIVGIPLAMAVLAVTIVGIPLAVLVLATYVSLLLLSGVFVSYRVGEWSLARMHHATSSRFTRTVIGSLIVSLGMTLPAVGWVVAIVVAVAGIGALTLERRDARTTAMATA